MGLIADKFFYKALKSDEDIMAMTSGRIFNTARTTEDERQDRIPYVVIMHMGMNNDAESKESWEGEYDTETVEILVVAETREDMAVLTTLIRRAVKTYREAVYQEGDDDDAPIDYHPSAGPLMYDPQKPCFYVTMRYECTTYND